MGAICTGGRVDPVLDGFLGSVTLRMLDSMRFDRVFLGAPAVDLKRGDVLTYDIEDATVKALVMRNSKRRYLLVDRTKFAAPGTFVYGRVGEFDALACDAATEEEKTAVARLGSMCL